MQGVLPDRLLNKFVILLLVRLFSTAVAIGTAAALFDIKELHSSMNLARLS